MIKFKLRLQCDNSFLTPQEEMSSILCQFPVLFLISSHNYEGPCIEQWKLNYRKQLGPKKYPFQIIAKAWIFVKKLAK